MNSEVKKPNMLAEFTSEGFKTTIEKVGEVLYVEQEAYGRFGESDLVGLDRDAQHALYLILKGRFED